MASPTRENRKNANSTATTATVVPNITRYRCCTSTPSSVTVDNPHGSPTWRTSSPMNALVTTRTTTSTPMVMIATTNTGLPIIGRSTVRSTPSASPAISTAATGTATKNPTSAARWLTSTAPASMNAGWAKLITLVDL